MTASISSVKELLIIAAVAGKLESSYYFKRALACNANQDLRRLAV